MLDGVFIASLIGSCVEAVKTAFTPTIPTENWANQKLMQEDYAKGMTHEEKLKNVKNGRYYIKAEKHEEPHRDANGRIVIENFDLYEEDYKKYGWKQVDIWVGQGRYNLTPEELRKAKERWRYELEHPEEYWKRVINY